MTGKAIRLSICIPTYNRAPFLSDLLTDLFSQQVDLGAYEVVVGNNASTDGTLNLLNSMVLTHPQLKHVRQRSNGGPYANLMTVFRMARGEYCLYVADDDRLNLAVVKEYLEFLDSNPSVLAAYTPSQFWNEQVGAAEGQSHQLDVPLVFGKSNGADLFNNLIQRNILPEIFVARSSALHAVLSMPCLAYWSYVWLANLIGLGDVAFLPQPYYRSITVHRGAGPSEHLGANEIISERDSYRAGLEYLIERMFQFMGSRIVPIEQRAAVDELINYFLDSRLFAATEVLLTRKNYIGAHEFLMRMLSRGLTDTALYEYFKQHSFDRRAVAQRILEIFNAVSPLEYIAFFKTDNATDLTTYLADLGASAKVRIVNSVEDFRRLKRGRGLVVVQSESDRDEVLAEGVLPGLTLMLSDIERQFVV